MTGSFSLIRMDNLPKKIASCCPRLLNPSKLAGLSTPSSEQVTNELAIDPSEMRRLMTMLLRDKTLVKMGTEELYFHQIALTKLRSQVADLRGQTIDVARFKQLTGLSRKYAIPLLEYLDRERVTRKVGERRLVL